MSYLDPLWRPRSCQCRYWKLTCRGTYPPARICSLCSSCRLHPAKEEPHLFQPVLLPPLVLLGVFYPLLSWHFDAETHFESSFCRHGFYLYWELFGCSLDSSPFSEADALLFHRFQLYLQFGQRSFWWFVFAVPRLLCQAVHHHLWRNRMISRKIAKEEALCSRTRQTFRLAPNEGITASAQRRFPALIGRNKIGFVGTLPRLLVIQYQHCRTLLWHLYRHQSSLVSCLHKCEQSDSSDLRWWAFGSRERPSCCRRVNKRTCLGRCRLPEGSHPTQWLWTNLWGLHPEYQGRHNISLLLDGTTLSLLPPLQWRHQNLWGLHKSCGAGSATVP